MVDLDLKDRKILYQLDLNCRQSNAQIGKKVGLSRKVVDYRIKRMEEKGIITGFWTALNAFRLGFSVYRYFITFQNAKKEIREKIINHLIRYENIWTVYSSSGLYDLGVIIWVKNIEEFYRFWEEFNDIYGDYISDKIFSVYLHSDAYRLTCLIPNNYDRTERDKYHKFGPGPIIEIDKVDYDLLNTIALKGKMSIVDISEKLNCSSQTVQYRIKNLIEKDLIKSFRVGIDYSKLGLEFYFISIWLQQLTKRKDIWRFLRYNPYVTFINTCAGYADIQFEIEINNSIEMQRLLDNLSDNFPNVIRKYNFTTVIEQFIVNCLPKMTKADFKK
jgi:DNA-binding Lrp family transcriptional regulator